MSQDVNTYVIPSLTSLTSGFPVILFCLARPRFHAPEGELCWSLFWSTKSAEDQQHILDLKVCKAPPIKSSSNMKSESKVIAMAWFALILAGF